MSSLIDKRPSILSGQYNNVSTLPKAIAKLRGSGKWNTNFPLSSNWPIPKHNQTQQPKTISQYIKELNSKVYPTYGSEMYWNLSELSPVADYQNTQWDQILSGKNKNLLGDAYQNFGLKVTHSTPTILLQLFFHEINVKYLQHRILQDIKQITGIDIKPQSEPALLQIMTNKYNASLFGSLPSTSVVHLAAPRGEKQCSMIERLTRLNQAVLQEAIKEILSGMNMYKTYYKDISSLPIPLSQPTYMSMKGSRVLAPNIGLTSGRSQSIASFNMRHNVIN